VDLRELTKHVVQEACASSAWPSVMATFSVAPGQGRLSQGWAHGGPARERARDVLVVLPEKLLVARVLLELLGRGAGLLVGGHPRMSVRIGVADGQVALARREIGGDFNVSWNLVYAEALRRASQDLEFDSSINLLSSINNPGCTVLKVVQALVIRKCTLHEPSWGCCCCQACYMFGGWTCLRQGTAYHSSHVAKELSFFTDFADRPPRPVPSDWACLMAASVSENLPHHDGLERHSILGPRLVLLVAQARWYGRWGRWQELEPEE
jgi:hypothetical protein